MKGPNSNFPLSAVSQRQFCISSSTPEAETVCGHFAYKNVLLLALDLWDALLPKGYVAQVHEVNQAMLQVAKSGRNPTMRHLHRVHRVGVAWLHERLGHPETKDPAEMVYTECNDMCADIHTLGARSRTNQRHRCIQVASAPPVPARLKKVRLMGIAGLAPQRAPLADEVLISARYWTGRAPTTSRNPSSRA